MLKKSIGREGNSRRPRSCALKTHFNFYKVSQVPTKLCVKKRRGQAMLKNHWYFYKRPRSCALKKAEAGYVKKTYRQGNSKRPRSCALEKDPRQAMLKKSIGREGNSRRPRSCALKKGGGKLC